jgi:Domain of unknown function (DUF5666)
MHKVISRRVTAGVMAFGIGVSVLGFGATGAFAAAKTKTASGTITSVKTDKLVVKVATKSDTFKTNAKTTIDLGGKTSTLAALKAGDTVTVDYTRSGKTLTATTVDATA